MRRVLLVASCLTSLLFGALVTRSGTADATGPTAPREAAVEDPDDNQAAGVGTEPDVSTHLLVPPVCAVTDEPAAATGYDDWRVTLLDTTYMLPPDYQPPDLVPAAGAFPVGSTAGGDGLVRAVVIDDLRALVEDAAAAGHVLAIQSAYRSYDYQASTFQYWVDRQGYDSAIATSARAGHSEHQLGTAVDLRAFDGPPAWELDDWGATPEGAWVAANAWRYGFVMSYPSGREALSCYAYEPWHYRYVGRELAATIQAGGTTAREALWRLAQGRPP